MKNFAFPIQLRACLFALQGLISRFLSVSIGIDIRFAHCRRLVPPVRWLLVICVCFPSISHASSPPANDEFFCLPLDYEDMRVRDSLYAATKQALNLNVGEPRTVRMIYFLPNDRPFQQAVVDSMKVTIRQIQTFYADQMEAHGYGRRTFRFETDAQGDPVVHRADGQYPDSHYLDDTVDTVYDEIFQAFDGSQNIYFIAIDNSINSIGTGSGRTAGGVGGRWGKNGGDVLVFGGFSVLVSGGYRFSIAAHELGHAFGLQHDFNDGAYIMSYGGGRNRLSACHAEFLSVHPYFNASIPAIEGSPPTIDIISTTEYTAGSKSIPVQLSVHDEDELHQVILFAQTREPHFAAGSLEVKACRALPDKYDYDAVVEFDYDGVIPSDNFSSLLNPDTHPIVISAVDAKGNVRNESFELTYCPLMLVKNSGDNQQGAPGSLLANLLMVEVRDKNGTGIEDIPVTFTVTTGDGKLSGRFTVENTTTDADGRVQSTLTLGPIAGTNTVEVSVTGLEPVIFNAVGVGTPSIPIMGGDYQTWHLPDGAIVRLGRGVIDGIGKALAFSPDGQLFAVASAIGIWLYDVATWREIELLTGHSRSVEAVAFSPDGTMLASGARDGTVKLWDVATQTHIATLWGHNGGVGSVSFSPSGKILASGSWQEVKLWDVETQTNIATLAGYSSQVLSLAFSPDGTTLAVSEAEGDEVKLWDVATRENIATFAEEGEVGGSIYSIAFSPDGTILASMYKNAITLWNVARKEKMTVFLHKDNVISLAFSPDGATIAGASWESVELWDIATGQNTATIKAYRVRSMVFAPNSTMLALGSLFDVTLYDIATKNATILSEYLMWVDSMDFSPDGTILASGYPDYIKLWDVATGQNIFTIDENNALFGGLVAFSPNGKIFAIESKRDIILWDVATRTTIATLKGHRNSLLSLSFSPDGTTLASGGYDRTVKIWDIKTQSNVTTFKGHTEAVYSVAFSPDGTTLASGGYDRTVKIWDIKTQSNVTTFKGHTEAVYSVAFSPDGTTLASGAQDETIKLWDVGTRRNIATLTGHTRSVNSVSFSPDGTLLASGSDPEVVLWDVATRTEVATFEGHTGSVKSVAFSPDGKELVSGSHDGTILLWDMSPYITPQTSVSAPTPDFDGDGLVGIPDFLLFVDQFGFSQRDVGYDARFDLDGDGVIGVSDFLIFVDNFGKKVS